MRRRSSTDDTRVSGRTAAGALAAVLAAGALWGCSGTHRSTAGTPARSTSPVPASHAPTAGPTGSAADAGTLAHSVIAAAGQAPPGTHGPSGSGVLGSVTLGTAAVPWTLAVTRLTAGPTQTVLELTARTVRPGTSTIPLVFSVEASYRLGDLDPNRSLLWFSVVDRTSRTRLFPYQYRWRPTSTQLACTCLNETPVSSRPQVWTLVLPPLPATTTAVDVVVPKGLTDAGGLASAAVATVRNVRVARS